MGVRRYRSSDEDSARWWDFPFREGDIVISTRSKSGTTWVQMICALLVFGSPELPAPLAELSPWLDWLVRPQEEVFEQLAMQHHRRFIKTHTPLDGIPNEPGVTYVVVGRQPLDMAVSLYHQNANIDHQRLASLTNQPVSAATLPSLHQWLVGWIRAQPDPVMQLDSLPGVFWHLSGAWERRSEEKLILVHYQDLEEDLEGTMRRLAAQLGFEVSEDKWKDLIEAASFEQMRARSTLFAPDPVDILKDKSAFFRRGSTGAAGELLSAEGYALYKERAAALQPDLSLWLHRAPL